MPTAAMEHVEVDYIAEISKMGRLLAGLVQSEPDGGSNGKHAGSNANQGSV